MVSNVLKTPTPELADLLKAFRTRYADDPEYRELRSFFPDDWPM